MTKLFLMLMVSLALLGAEEKRPAAKTKRPEPPPTQVPEGATKIDMATWRHVDKDGKAWIYRKTPFALVKLEDKAPPEPRAEVPNLITAVEDGDSVKFEKPSPFSGSVRWTKKKTDLNPAEQAAWKRAQEQQAKETTAAAKPREK